MDNTICVNSKRLIWLDQLKAISMYLVILGHSLLKFKKHLMFKVIYSFHMPLFFIISGFTFNPNKYERISECIKDKIIKLVYPYIMLNILVLPLWYINKITGMVPHDSFIKVLIGIFYSNASVVRAPSNATWFLMTMFLTQIIYYTLYHYLKDDKSVFIMSCVMCLTGLIAPLGKEEFDAPLHLDVALVAQFYYGSGYILRKNFRYFQKCLANKTFLKILAIVIIASFFCLINKQVDLSNELYRNFTYTLITSLSFSFVLIYVVFRSGLHFKDLSYIGKNTLIILALHIPLLRILQAFFPLFQKNQVYAVLASIIIFIIMIPIIWFINKFLKFIIKMPMFLKKIIIKD